MTMVIESRELPATEESQVVCQAPTISQKLSEVLWGLLCLVLFMILGPFSAPIALIAVFRLARDVPDVEPEPLEK